MSKEEHGGIGFRNLHSFHQTMFGKHDWNFITNPRTLASRMIKAKYFPHGNVLTTQLGANPSFI